jgi:hypothetical protein
MLPKCLSSTVKESPWPLDGQARKRRLAALVSGEQGKMSIDQAM